MSRKIFFALFGAFLIYFSCAAQPGPGDGGGGGGGTPSDGIVINTSNPSETLNTVPELKLKLEDMPDSLSDNNLKLKSPRLRSIVSTLDPLTLPDVKSEAWYSMVSTIQQESMAQSMLEGLKGLAKSTQIPVGRVVTLAPGYAVKCVLDGKGGLAYYFTIKDTEITLKLYLDVYPTNGKAAVEFIGDYEMSHGGQTVSFRMYSYYNEATGEMIDSMEFLGIAFLWQVWRDTPDSMSIITYLGLQGSEYLSVGWGDDNYGGVINSSQNYIYKEYYNNNGGLVYRGVNWYGDTYSLWPLKYLRLDDDYTNYEITREVVDRYTHTNEWIWEGSNYTYIYTWTCYNWWLDKNRDKNYSSIDDIEINDILYQQNVYLWNDSLKIIVPQKAVFAYGTGDKPDYFRFIRGSLITNVNQKIDPLYNKASEQNFIDFITNRQIPNPENFPNP